MWEGCEVSLEKNICVKTLYSDKSYSAIDHELTVNESTLKYIYIYIYIYIYKQGVFRQKHTANKLL